MPRLLALLGTGFTLLAATPSTLAQAAYFDHRENGLCFGYQHADVAYYNADAVALTYVGDGLYEVSAAYSWESYLDVFSIGLGAYPLKQGRSNMPLSLGLGFLANIALLDGFSGETSFSALPLALQSYRWDVGADAFLVQSAQLSYPVIFESGVEEVWRGTVGLEFVLAPRRDFFAGIGYSVTFQEGENVKTISLTFALPLSTSESGDDSVAW